MSIHGPAEKRWTAAMQSSTTWDTLREADLARNGLVESLIAENESLTLALESNKRQLDLKDILIKRHVQHANELERDGKELQRRAASHQFVSVLVDGDGTKFRELFLRNEVLGGQEAASALRDCVQEYVNRHLPQIGHHFDIVIQVFANIEGLSRYYVKTGIHTVRNDLNKFIQGFNMSHGLVSFVDGGVGKECADVKMRAFFELHVQDIHCKHIIFAGSGDNGYARLLGKWRGDKKVSTRVTLLEGGKVAQEMADLVGSFKSCAFPSVFYSTPKELRAPAAETPLKTLEPAMGSTLQETLAIAPDVAARHLTKSQSPPSGPPNGIPPNGGPPNGIPCNSRGQRVDPKLTAISTALDRITPLKLCNNHYLNRTCSSELCYYEHRLDLSQSELEALRFHARRKPCPEGTGCRDLLCYYGHSCPRRSCSKVECRFSPTMHHVENKINHFYLATAVPYRHQ